MAFSKVPADEVYFKIFPLKFNDFCSKRGVLFHPCDHAIFSFQWLALYKQTNHVLNTLVRHRTKHYGTPLPGLPVLAPCNIKCNGASRHSAPE